MSNKSCIHNTRIQSGVLKQKKYIFDSESENDSDSENENENESESENENEKKFDKLKYYKFLNSLYPSKYSKNKVLNEINNNKRYKKNTSDFKINNFENTNYDFLNNDSKLTNIFDKIKKKKLLKKTHPITILIKILLSIIANQRKILITIKSYWLMV